MVLPFVCLCLEDHYLENCSTYHAMMEQFTRFLLRQYPIRVKFCAANAVSQWPRSPQEESCLAVVRALWPWCTQMAGREPVTVSGGFPSAGHRQGQSWNEWYTIVGCSRPPEGSFQDVAQVLFVRSPLTPRWAWAPGSYSLSLPHKPQLHLAPDSAASCWCPCVHEPVPLYLCCPATQWSFLRAHGGWATCLPVNTCDKY